MTAGTEKEAAQNLLLLEKLHGTYTPQMRKRMLSEQFVVDKRSGDPMWGYVKVALMPLGPKHVLGFDRLPIVPKAATELHTLQQEWGVSEKAFPAMIFVAQGTQSHKGIWAMVEPDDFLKDPSDLMERYTGARQTGNETRMKILDLTITV